MMAVHWATDYEGVAHSFGYATHNERARQALAATGVRIDTSAPVAVHVGPPHLFKPIKGKFNVAYCAWEYRQLPGLFAKTLKDADAICVTASFLKEPFQSMLPDTPVHVIPLGVDFSKFQFVDRMSSKLRPIDKPARRGGRPLRFLWVGAPNARKGPKHVLKVWNAFKPGGFLDLDERVELYIKTTVHEGTPAYKGLQRLGNITYDTRRLPIDDLAALYKSAHCFLFPSAGEGFGLCVHPSTRLQLIDGRTKPIRDIQPGDRVMDDSGGMSIIEAKTSRKVGELYRVRTTLGYDVCVTAEHPFLASVESRRKKVRSVDWIPVTELQTGNFIAVAKAKLNADLPATIDLGQIAGLISSDREVWFRMGYSGIVSNRQSLSELSRRFNETKKVCETAVSAIRHGRTLQRGSRSAVVAKALISENYLPAEPKKYPRYISVSDGFLRFLGWYIAEGSATDAAIELSCGIHDQPHLHSVVEWLESQGAKTNVIKDGYKLRVTACHGALSRWLLAACGSGASNKAIPSELYRSGARLAPLIETIFRGDGGKSASGTSLTTASPTLANQVRQILSGWSIACSIRRDRRTGCRYVGVDGTMGDKLASMIDIPVRCANRKTSRTGSSAIDFGDYLLLPIRKIERMPYCGSVFDIQVRGRHSFVGNGLILHNTFAEALATGLPSIYTAETAMLDIAPPQLGLGYPVATQWVDEDWHCDNADGNGNPMTVHVWMPSAIVNDLVHKMVYVLNNYDEACERGRMAADYVRRFTWEECGRRLRKVIDGIRKRPAERNPEDDFAFASTELE